MVDNDEERWASDASPPKGHKYFNSTEEGMVLRGSTEHVAGAVAREGLGKVCQLIRRALPITVLGEGERDAAQKLSKLGHKMIIETGVGEELVEQRRATGVGWPADQGTETKVGDGPNPWGDICTLMRGLGDGTLTWQGKEATCTYFLPNALVIPKGLHANFSAPFEAVFREFVRLSGDRQLRDRFIVACMKGSKKWERRLRHRFPVIVAM